MQIPILSRRGNRKPWSSIPRIDWSHPLTANLLFYHYDTGTGGYDLAQSREMTLRTANGIPRGHSQWGSGYNFANTTADGIQYQSTGGLRSAPPFSWATGFNRPVAATESGASFFSRAANDFGTNPFVNWGFDVNHLSNAGTVGANVNSGGSFQSTVSVTASLGAYHSLLATCPAAATSIVWWFDGLPQTTKTGLTIQSITTGDNTVIGTDGGGPNGYQGWVYYGAFWNRLLTQAEATLLHLNPYCFLIYPEDDIFAELVGVTAATTSEDQWHQGWSNVGRRYAIIGAG